MSPRAPSSHVPELLFGLRPRLLLLVALAILPALGMMVYTAAEQRTMAATEAETNALRAAHVIADNQALLVENARHVLQAKKAIRTAFEAQIDGLGFSVVELLSSCPTNWGMTPNEALCWVEDQMVPFYPLGDYKVDERLQNRKGAKK